jgi:hypothetical protein
LFNDELEEIAASSSGSGYSGTFCYFGRYSGFTNLSFVLPKKIRKIGNNAFIDFGGSSSLASTFTLDFSNCVQLIEIGGGSFSTLVNCSTTNLVFPNSLEKIGNYAFDGVKSINSVTCGPNLTQIGERVFNHCDNLQTITLESNSIVGNYNNMSYVVNRDFLRYTKILPADYLTSTPALGAKIYVPSSLLSSYQSSNLWNAYYNTNNLFEAIP